MRLPITALRGALLGLLLAGLHACSQQTEELPTPARSESAFSAADAQSWYQGVIASPSTDRQQAGVASARALPPPSNPAPQLLQWGRTRTVGQGADQLLLVPLGNDAALFAHSTYVGTRYLIVTRNPSGALDGNILELLLRRTAAPVDTTALFASLYRNYHSGQWAAPVSGDGLVVLYSANYQYLTGRRFRAGHFLAGTARLAFQLHSSTTTNAANRGVVANGGVGTNGGMTTNFTEMPEETCIDWYDGNTGAYITSTGSCGGGGTGGGGYEPPYTGPGTNGPGGYDPNPTSGGGGVNNPGSSGTTSATFDANIDGQTLQPCMATILAQIKSINAGQIGFIIQGFSGQIPGYNWTLRNGSLPANTFGSTTSSLVNHAVVTTFDASLFANASDLSVARTIMHESVHAYLVASFENDRILAQAAYPHLVQAWLASKHPDLNALQHDQMVGTLVQEIAYGLQQYGQAKGYTLPNDFYISMAWGGLEGTRAFQNLGTAQKQQIRDIILGELTGQDSSGNSVTKKGNSSGC